MMSGMPSHPADRNDRDHRPVVDSPTVIMPSTGGRHAADGGMSPRWLIGVIGGGAILTVGLGALVGLLLSSGGPARAPASGIAAPSAAVETVDEPMTTASVDASPTPSPSTSVGEARAAELIAAMRSTIRDLARADRIDGDAADDLDDDLKAAARALAADEVGKALDELRDVAERIQHLHEEGDLPDREFQQLATAMTQIGQALPRA